jgi:hypothetical protein
MNIIVASAEHFKHSAKRIHWHWKTAEAGQTRTVKLFNMPEPRRFDEMSWMELEFCYV